MNEKKWTENVIVADADYADSVAFDLTVNFERMLERRVPQADMAKWVECVALDGGLRQPAARAEGQQTVQVVLIHQQQQASMKNFVPARYADELDGKAFRSELGEFVFTAVQTEAGVADKEQLLLDTLQMVCQQEDVKRLMVVVPDQLMDGVRQLLRRHDSDSRRTTVFTMQPQQGGAFRHELLGYSLMAALGISSAEIDRKLKN